MVNCKGWEQVLAFLRTRQIAGVECVGENTYRRTASGGWVEATFGVETIAIAASTEDLQNEANLRFPRLFDLHADSGSIGSHLRKDRHLGRSLAKGANVRLPGCWDPFEIAVRAIIGQQISVAAARTILGRL